jgi:hypothetical protein
MTRQAEAQSASSLSHQKAGKSGPKELTRRHALVVGTGTLAGVAGISYALADSDPLSPVEVIEKMVLDHLPYLTIDPESLRQYASLYHRWQADHERRKPRKDIVERFLKSSNFFQNGADESKTVKFVAFFDPYSSPCYSPFTAGD